MCSISGMPVTTTAGLTSRLVVEGTSGILKWSREGIACLLSRSLLSEGEF